MDTYKGKKLKSWMVAALELENKGDLSRRKIAKAIGISRTKCLDFLRGFHKWDKSLKAPDIEGAKVLVLDIETAPVKASVWGLWNNNVGLNMIEADWYILSWAAKWIGSDEIYYEDKSQSWDTEDDSELLKNIWTLMDQADVILTQNGIKFDNKKLNARFLLNGMPPVSNFRNVDTLVEAKKHFSFTSNRLEYMTDKLCKRYKKQTQGKFAGFELWSECMKGNAEAWEEMRNYNMYDILSLEELYVIMRPFMKSHYNVNLYTSSTDILCKCGGDNFTNNGYAYTNLSKFDRFKCDDCGAEVRGRVNLLSKEKRESLRMNVS